MNLPLPPPAATSVAFGPFHLFASARRLEKNGVPVKIGNRALDILICLAEQPGKPVSNRVLLERVWRGVVVEEGSLRVNIAALRRILGEGDNDNRYVTNIPARGYCLTAPLSQPSIPAASVPVNAVYALPGPPRKLVGGSELVPALTAQLRASGFLTLCGPGGIGKTATALAIAHSVRTEFQDAVCFVDLSVLTAPDQMVDAIRATLGLPASASSVQSLSAWLQERRFLLILDNCEHLIDAIASLAEQLHRAAPGLSILATSREALRVEGERTHQLLPLACPPAGIAVNAAQALSYPAVQLFVDRVRDSCGGFELSDDEAPLVAGICRQLDGMALGVEFSASRAAIFGVRGAADLLDKGSLLTCQVRRTALPRHRTLTALLDWSYQLLSDCERTVLRRLSVFAGRFSLEAALSVVAGEAPGQSAIVATLESLVAKSLVCTEMAPQSTTYRLLACTRAYAAEKLAASGEGHLIARRNAELTAAF